MRLTALACISLATLLSACGTPDGGYYDANGNWIPNNPNNATRNHAPLPGGTHDAYDNDDYRHRHHVTTYSYDRPGYYNTSGYYDRLEGGAPASMMPPRGMCRVWFTDRLPENQPRIESCDGIQYRVPEGAYVIYGG